MQWASTHGAQLAQATAEHLVLSLVSVLLAVLVAVPLGVWIHGNRVKVGAVTGIAGALYTIPSLALFALLVPVLGLGWPPTMLGLVLYAQLILVRAVLTALDTVPADVRDAAIGMGIDRWTILTRVDAPLALPVFLSGLRVAVVTVIGIATIGGLIDAGGLGSIIMDGIERDYPSKVLAGAMAVTALALAADFLLVRLERAARPWQRHTS